MDAIQYVQEYKNYLNEIREVIKPELHYIIDQLIEFDPHDHVRPESWFVNESAARGYVWTLFLRRTKEAF